MNTDSDQKFIFYGTFTEEIVRGLKLKTSLLQLALLLPIFGLVLSCMKTSEQKTCESGPGLADIPIHGHLPEKTLALTFDDGPTQHTEELAAYLHQAGAPSTFFVIGSKALMQPKTLGTLRSQGHLVANHTNSHPDLTKTGNAAQEVRRADAAISPYVSGNIFLFRAPYGQFNINAVTSINAAGLGKYYGPIHWDIGEDLTETSAADWACVSKNISATACAGLYLQEIRAKKGGVVLMHDSVSYITELVKLIVEPLKQEGWRFVRIDESETIAQEIRKRGGTPGAVGGTSYCYDY